jgi:hypothetical protein
MLPHGHRTQSACVPHRTYGASKTHGIGARASILIVDKMRTHKYRTAHAISTRTCTSSASSRIGASHASHASHVHGIASHRTHQCGLHQYRTHRTHRIARVPHRHVRIVIARIASHASHARISTASVRIVSHARTHASHRIRYRIARIGTVLRTQPYVSARIGDATYRAHCTYRIVHVTHRTYGIARIVSHRMHRITHASCIARISTHRIVITHVTHRTARIARTRTHRTHAIARIAMHARIECYRTHATHACI